MYKKYQGFQSELYLIILDWFQKGNILDKNIYDNLNNMSEKHGNVVFQVVFDIVANLDLSPVKARNLWIKIWKYKNDLEKRINKKIDFRVVLLEYLLEINHKLKNPKIIEMNLFEKTKDSLIIDELTQLYNYRFFKNQLKYEIARALRMRSLFSILLIDIDDFKKINDTYGHEDANKLLKKFSKIFQKAIRKDDLAFRYGGDEFVIFLHNTNKLYGFETAEKIRNLIAKTKVKIDKNVTLSATISIGVSSFPLDAKHLSTLINKADKAMQMSKRKGKNCVSLYSISSRTLNRVKIVKNIIVRSLSEKKSSIYPIHDISNKGLAFYKSTPLEAGTYTQLFFDVKLQIPFLIKIVQVNKIADYRYIVGGIFVDMDNLKYKILSSYIKKAS